MSKTEERVKVFLSDVHFDIWHSRNCAKCVKGFYMNGQQHKCELEMELTAQVGLDGSGAKFLKPVADEIGLTTQKGSAINRRCLKFDDGTKKEPPMPLPGQQSLFKEEAQ